jgi:hypothetical protein
MSRVTPWTENGMQDVTDADPKSPGTKVAVSKVQGRSRPLDESSGTSLPILPYLKVRPDYLKALEKF